MIDTSPSGKILNMPPGTPKVSDPWKQVKKSRSDTREL